MKKTNKLLIALIAAFAFFAIFSAKSNAATIEKIVFDNSYYIATYPDLQKEYGFNNEAAAYNHFMTCGINEGRTASPTFSVTYYKEKNSDLSGMSNREAYEHFVYHGINEDRTASPLFDLKYYVNSYPDLVKAFINEKGEINYSEVYDHYVYHGIYEGRNPNADVDLVHYVNAYSDLKKAFVKDGYTDWKEVAEHWFFHGVTEGREGLHKGKVDEATAKEATCEEAGKKADTVCELCGLTVAKGEEIPALGHDIKVTEHSAASCTGKCSRCSKEITTEHNDETMTEWKADEGAQTHSRKCEICGQTETAPCNSTFVPADKVATCTEAGTAAYFDCTVCHRHASEDHTVPALGHDFKYDATVEDKDQHKCSRCGEVEECVYDETITQGDAENHVINGTCKTCGHQREPQNVKHNYETKISKDQKQHYNQCKDCGYIDESSRKDHEYEYTQKEVGAWKGHVKTCKVCGKSAQESCSFSQTRITESRSATCEVDGVKASTYKACLCGRPEKEVTPMVVQ